MPGDFIHSDHLYKPFIEFDVIDRKRLQVAVSRITRAKIIQCEQYSLLM